MKRRNLILTVLILALVLSAGIGSAWAYFTTFAEAKGGMALELGYKTEFEEEVTEARKVVNIHYNTAGGENSQEVYVRVRAWSPDGEKYPLSVAGDGWQLTGDWWVYLTPLGPEALDAAPLTIQIGGLEKDDLAQLGDSINVAVVHECAPVLYETDGTPVPATDGRIWDQQLIVANKTASEGGE